MIPLLFVVNLVISASFYFIRYERGRYTVSVSDLFRFLLLVTGFLNIALMVGWLNQSWLLAAPGLLFLYMAEQWRKNCPWSALFGYLAGFTNLGVALYLLGLPLDKAPW